MRGVLHMETSHGNGWFREPFAVYHRGNDANVAEIQQNRRAPAPTTNQDARFRDGLGMFVTVPYVRGSLY